MSSVAAASSANAPAKVASSVQIKVLKMQQESEKNVAKLVEQVAEQPRAREPGKGKHVDVEG